MDEVGAVKESIVKRLNAAQENPLYAIRDCIVELAEHIDKINSATIQEKEKPKRAILTAQEMKFMKRFGWEFSRVPSTKHDLVSGKVLAHEGDETWVRDLKVAGE